ncbi:MAG: hypothetical protein F6K35_28495 [Okeania sp. SIO2H7]|nr:hypothetical protein [Okeania sp. SIO2H7]
MAGELNGEKGGPAAGNALSKSVGVVGTRVGRGLGKADGAFFGQKLGRWGCSVISAVVATIFSVVAMISAVVATIFSVVAMISAVVATICSVVAMISVR